LVHQLMRGIAARRVDDRFACKISVQLNDERDCAGSRRALRV